MSTTDLRVAGDGVTGEYRPAPASVPSARPQGQGLTGVESELPDSRRDLVNLVRTGSVASVHSWELVTAVDGPGTRMTVFFSGCPLRCLYCHNPDTMEMRRGEQVQTASLIDRMLRYRRIFARTGGGITLSGGEPLMQPKAVARILRAAKTAGIHTAIDTSGNLGWRCTDEMLADLDLCLLDLKSGHRSTYQQVTGARLEPTVAFGQRLARAGVEVWVRFVLVPGVTDDPENIAEVARLAAQISTCTRVEVLPFHQMGRDKWDELGMEYQLAEVEPPSAAAVESARQIFRRHGLTTY